ncbi:MAG: methyltransferase FkbM [uncultured bacterium]|uniref:Methyltransferase FkbM domain-containing protein n=1 Tax=Candidatus Daviesbacteria bacterium GW2011_GWC2_40_12 TaxID=1618431 RepID=A0A0G0QZ50_9BACT|nr:MAG: methyltransferase FkbM [uncultured bacterium]KKQ82992.1 MAG: hypothetical protein UT04_C0041G0002 [Candidatus Daviesbacteria bacterium GW2011_GWF2_38_7]KKR17292.1 MAG: hypothetical protein UT45_C0002G0121 [Candidatus Daviesbacteria bacterium GW2011_GWA2_39_33]KKR42691.1 MAG: hypothetical protein UT77_C0001G0142 [Candidatus Daviesbacteria bacterium GW2011_GWC2_40_12]OGE21364.1 MAG: hypothetical protein A2778_04320 [Candidatus Daviesbacteria bacterium RIFCSPHIGHO2_01_FULL_40_24]OGE30118.
MFKIFGFTKKNKEIIRRCYLTALEREPDEVGLNHYLKMMRSIIKPNGIDEKKLIKILKESGEGKKVKLAKVYDHKPPYVFTGLYNIKYWIRPNSVLDNAIVKNGIFNGWLCTKLKGLINKDSVIFDVGANAGLLSLPFAKKCVPLGKVYSFDPDEKVVSQLKKNIKLNSFSNIIVEEMALQDNPATEKVTLNINRAVQDNGLRNDGLSTIVANLTYKISEKIVNASTIDRYVKENKIKKIEFIKIDAEGADLKVLKGGRETIKKSRPIVFYEHSPVLERFGNFKNLQKAFMFMQKLGYKQYLKVKNKKLDLIEIKKYSQGLPDGDIICFHKLNLPN